MRVFSAIQPSGALHVGNYLGAIKQWVDRQSSASLYCVADLHALTLQVEPADLRRNVDDLLIGLLAAGLDPEVCTLFVQSQVSYHAQLGWLLECVATHGELTRMTQFKEKAGRHQGYRVGLLTYPVLMAADILLYQTDEVPVGDDQRQHLELARTIAERFNNRFGPVFTVPVGTRPPTAARVMDLQEPTRKMSKSIDSPLGTLYVLDTPDAIAHKVKKAVTDTDGDVRFDWETKPGLANLLELFAGFSDERPDDIAARYSRYGDLKRDLADLIIARLSPIAERYRTLQGDPQVIDGVVRDGARKASVIAQDTYARASAAMGLR